MPLTVVIGRANSGKTGVAYGVVRASLARRETTALLLPSMPDVRRAQNELARECPTGLLISQADGFLAGTWDTRGDGRAMVTPPQRALLAMRAVRQAAVIEDERSPDGVVELVARLAERAAQEGVPPQGRARDARAEAIVSAVGGYQELLASSGLVEPGEAAHRLSVLAPGATTLVLHRFVDLTASQEAVLLGWAAQGADVWLTLPYDPGVAATRALRPLVERLHERGAVLSRVPSGPGYSPEPELERLETELFAAPAAAPATGAVRLAIAQGEESEARLAAQAVGGLISQGVRPERIAVVYRDLDRHHPWLRRELEAAGIAADIDVRTPFAATPFGRALLRLWDVASPAVDSDLAAFLRTPFSGVAPEIAVTADMARRRSGVAVSRGSGKSAADTLVAKASLLRREAVDARTVAEWQELADSLLRNAYPGDAAALPASAEADTRAHAALLRVVGDLVGLGGTAVTGQDVVDIVRRVLVGGSSRERAGHVQVLDVDRVRSRRFEAVVLGGLTSGEFPRRGAGDWLEGEAVRSACARLGLRAMADEAERERLLFYLTVTQARRSLVLMRQEADADGSPIRGSVFWDEMLDLYRDPIGDDEQGAPEPARLTLAELAHESMVVAPVCAHRGLLADPRAKEALAARTVFSASELESYCACPYRWFLERHVRPAAPDVRLDSRSVGTLSHAALAATYRLLPERTRCRRVTQATIESALAVADQAWDAAVTGTSAPRTLDERHALESARAGVRGLIERDAGFLPGYEPAHIEWAFGVTEEDAEDLGGFRLKGRADRIDCGPEGLIVIDYKSSRADKQADFAALGLVQLQLYAEVARRRLGMPIAGGLYRSLHSSKDRGFYLQGLDSPGLAATDALSAEDVEALVAAGVEAAGTAVAGIRSGDIRPRPDALKCGHCVWSPWCGEAL
jgi:RecB family exonuclease